MPLSTQTKTQITALLATYAEAYNSHDTDQLCKTLAPDIIFYGCRKDEEASGRDAVAVLMHTNFSRYKTGAVRFGDPDIKGEGIITWLSTDCTLLSTVGNGTIHETPARFTAVFRGTGHAWEITQIHMSLAYPYHE